MSCVDTLEFTAFPSLERMLVTLSMKNLPMLFATTSALDPQGKDVFGRGHDSSWTSYSPYVIYSTLFLLMETFNFALSLALWIRGQVKILYYNIIIKI